MFASSPTPARPPLPAALAERVRPVATASSRLLPLAPALLPLFGGAGLQRGTTTCIAGPVGVGARTLALTMLSAASAAGHWCGVVGLADPGVSAMVELGLDLRRVVFVPSPGGRWSEAAAELFDGADLVLIRPAGPVAHGVARLLVSRARERRAALVVLTTDPARWPLGPERCLVVRSSSWVGVDRGHGHLAARRAEVEVLGRRGASRRERHQLWLPARAGQVLDAAG